VLQFSLRRFQKSARLESDAKQKAPPAGPFFSARIRASITACHSATEWTGSVPNGNRSLPPGSYTEPRDNAGSPAGFSIGSLGSDKSNLLKGKGAINRLLSRDDCCLFAMRLASHDCSADECGPFPHMPPDAFDDRIFDTSILHHIDRTYGGWISFPTSNLGASGRVRAAPVRRRVYLLWGNYSGPPQFRPGVFGQGG
jgi:hypothetical protein